jgi:putative PIN family toxin of toxin-antitoxin system
VSDEILAEYREVLARPKFGLDAVTLASWLDLLVSATESIEAGPAMAFPRDPADAVFLSCAFACQADYLITGDRDFTVARRLGNTAIVSVSLFERVVCPAF